ncbi:ABC transporter substrate-binding protein [Sphingomonas sp.]|jgi:peptide/nickel transport system substrate-binding protein|uniref:ABC transporter substrate-binding protein n=1 Tax=Sphingomonas sp. TaxID=28214 RepID=UPI002E3270E5|nr:ABC transporter substrate-binding protein [Sphingomonas sp.]HEX4694819.1 ABC transporter substrate-binding protein [Sphingomonas sp.]
MISRWLLPTLILGLAACTQRPDKGPVVVSAIGARAAFGDVNKRSPDLTQRLLLDSTAQGLVRFDAAGQIEPGLAERWIVIDSGRTYIFRLREAEWSDGEKVTAADVATILKRAIAPGSRNPLKPFLSAIDDVAVMTDAVIEVRLSRPRPDLLKLFAQPELAVLRMNPIGGSGPFRIAANDRGALLLRPAIDPARSPDDEAAQPSPEQDVELIGESASRAVVRFATKLSDYVAGGAVADFPLVAHSGVAPTNIKLDPAVGLFGLAVVRREGLLASAAGRAAIAEAIDRSALIAALTSDWGAPVERLLPDKLDSAAPPAIPTWTTLSPDARLAAARAQVAKYRATNPGPIVVRIALPAGPGGTILYGQIAARLILIGVQSVRVAPGAEADLRLVDAVAPYDSARWYLATACVVCSPEAQAALTAARDAPDMASRGQHIAEADGLLASDVAFIPLATPLRWSLVALRLKQWQGNPRAWHPLNRLRNDPT